MKKTIIAASMVALFGLGLCMNTAAKAEQSDLHPLCKAHGDVAEAAQRNNQEGVPLQESVAMSSVDKSGMSTDITIMAYGKHRAVEALQPQIIEAFKNEIIGTCQSVLGQKKIKSVQTNGIAI